MIAGYQEGMLQKAKAEAFKAQILELPRVTSAHSTGQTGHKTSPAIDLILNNIYKDKTK